LNQLVFSLQLLVLVIDNALKCFNRLLGCLSKSLTFLLEELFTLLLVGDETVCIITEHASSQISLKLGGCHDLAVLHSKLVQLWDLPSHRCQFSELVL
jgi:hypothetical protein